MNDQIGSLSCFEYRSCSLTQLEAWFGVDCFAYKLFIFGNLLVQAWSQCGGLNIESQTHFGMPKGAKMSLAPNRIFSFKPPHQFQACMHPKLIKDGKKLYTKQADPDQNSDEIKD